MAERRFASIEAFYTDVPARRLSREIDYGVMWREPGVAWPMWRVSYVVATGEFYAVQSKAGPAEVVRLGRAIDHSDADRILTGWAEQCSRPGSLQWVRMRLHQGGRPSDSDPRWDQV